MPLTQVQELVNAFLGIATLKDVFKAKELEETSKVLKKSDTRQ
jgi:hypothetical protein